MDKGFRKDALPGDLTGPSQSTSNRCAFRNLGWLKGLKNYRLLLDKSGISLTTYCCETIFLEFLVSLISYMQRH